MNIPRPDLRAGTIRTPAEIPCDRQFALGQEDFERAKIVGFDSHDERSRAFNMIRSQFLRDIDERGHKVVGITSPTPGAGKSFISLNLAAAISRYAQRAVLLCDLDLRRGSIGHALNIDQDTDVSAILRGEVDDFTSAITRLQGTDLYVMPCRVNLRGSAELLSAPRFETLVAELRGLPEGTIVLCDLPPVFASDDALLTAHQLDSYLLVVEYGRNSAMQVRETMRLLSPLPCIGSVLNRYKGGFFDAYGYGYGDPYGIRNYGAGAR